VGVDVRVVERTIVPVGTVPVIARVGALTSVGAGEDVIIKSVGVGVKASVSVSMEVGTSVLIGSAVGAGSVSVGRDGGAGCVSAGADGGTKTVGAAGNNVVEEHAVINKPRIERMR